MRELPRVFVMRRQTPDSQHSHIGLRVPWTSFCSILLALMSLIVSPDVNRLPVLWGQTVYFGGIGEEARQLSIISYADACKCKTRMFVYLISIIYCWSAEALKSHWLSIQRGIHASARCRSHCYGATGGSRHVCFLLPVYRQLTKKFLVLIRFLSLLTTTVWTITMNQRGANS